MDVNAINTTFSLWRSHATLRTLYLMFLGVDAPITQSTFTYLTLAMVYGGILLYRRQRLRVAWYWYLLLGFVDVQGNYLAWAIILTSLFLGTRYSIWQLLGAALCVLGLGLVLVSDAGVGGGGGSRPLLGDILVIAATMFMAMSNVGEEFFVKKKDLVEVISMIGVYGLLVSIIQLSILELRSLESVKWSTDIILSFVGYVISSFMFYTLVPFALKLSGATMFNLSMLTSDMWAVVIRILFYHQQVDWLYYLAFVIVVIGLIIYSTTEKDPIPIPALENGNHDAEYHFLDSKNVASRNDSLDS